MKKTISVDQLKVGMYLEGKIKPAVSKEYPLAEAKAALADAAGRRLLGKAVLLCG